MAKLIAITGNSGKTILSFYLSNLLAQNDKKVVIISTDGTMPVAKMLLPSSNVDKKSLGKLLSLAVITPNSILDNTVISPGNKNLGVISYAPGESHLHYPKVTEQNIDELIQALHSLVDYIIVDTQTIRNPIDKYILATCQTEICIISADVKGLYYREYYKCENATNILFDCNPYNPVEDMAKSFKKLLRYIIPTCGSLFPIYNGVDISTITPPKKYIKVLQTLIKEVIGIEQHIEHQGVSCKEIA